MTIQKLTIGALSKQTGVKVTTIRYYESIGLLPEPMRSVSGQRNYHQSAIECLNFIRHSRELGFSMDMIRELIELEKQPNQTCEKVDELASKHLSGVRLRLKQLKSLESELENMVSNCKGGKIEACAVMGCLSNHDECNDDRHDKIDLKL